MWSGFFESVFVCVYMCVCEGDIYICIFWIVSGFWGWWWLCCCSFLWCVFVKDGVWKRKKRRKEEWGEGGRGVGGMCVGEDVKVGFIKVVRGVLV